MWAWSLDIFASGILVIGTLGMLLVIFGSLKTVFIPSINEFSKKFCDNLLILLGQHECFLVIFAATKCFKDTLSYTAFFSLSTMERLFVLCSRLRHSLCWTGLWRVVLLEMKFKKEQ